MVRFSSILIAYFVVGAVMWGGGVISWDNAGIGSYIIDDPTAEEDQLSNDAVNDLKNLGGPIGNIVGTLGGGLVAVWSIMSKFIGFLFWPITVLLATGAPPRVVVLGGGTLSIAFIASFLRTVRGSA